MAWSIEWAGAAWNDLQSAADYIAKDSPRYAAAFVREVRDASRSLAHLAERGRIVPELGNPQIRELFVRNFRLIYGIEGRSAYILGVIHGARDLWAAWDEKRKMGP